MRTLSKDEIIEFLSDSNNSHIKAILRLINDGTDLSTALTIGIVSLSVEQEDSAKKTNEMQIQRNMPKTNDMS